VRTTDPEPTPFQPLGDRVKAPAPAPTPWKQLRPGVWEGPDGKLATEPPKEK
jgi:hypothetical protein